MEVKRFFFDKELAALSEAALGQGIDHFVYT